ncbi:histone deacetylase family protein [Comamonas piscis]|uniref:Histone deacetylase family protein n=1 Tax=Comamonas piscis TaxID=1562974 RepID=A0A7G5EHK1_9BURK|nr:histone deacetylase family protein [Comamonas piscis]QMV73476.1 histone deacetylase family protein [Comamonas piscis]WSO31891.1 histone deacetylase family protein [Comamonas piscis]
MKFIYSHEHRSHDPQQFMVRGQLKRSNEQPERAEILLRSAQKAGHQPMLVEDFGAGPRAAVHTPEYLHFLQTAWQRWQALPDASLEVLPNVFPFPGQPFTYPDHLVGQAGYHMGDCACSIGEHTWHAAINSAHCATHAAELVLQGEQAAYALCRPPGHHAYVDRANGFCYLNNAAIAAQHLRSKHARVAVLDIDVHHGNGTQGIFWRRNDVLTVSIHADPHFCTPFFTGHAHERGEGEGLGYNLNLPQAKGTTTDQYLRALETALTAIRHYAPGALVLALGLDAHEHDPYKALAIDTPGFARITEKIAQLGLPTVIVQEGGYLSEDLGLNLESALRGFEVGAQ